MSRNKRNVYTIVLIGDSEVGKTCMVNKLCYGSIPIDYEPTIEDLHTTIVLTEKVEVIDTSPDEIAQSLRKSSLKTADAVMLVYDSQNRRSTDNLFWHLEELRSVHDWKSFQHLPAACLVVGVAKHVGPVDKGAEDEGKKFAHHWGMEHLNVRLKSISVRTAFEKCVFMIEERREFLSSHTVQKVQHCKCCILL
jgi:tRNA U34 5-carboxymethylaminomethyl modifying GTPase MnmE/TrmE